MKLSQTGTLYGKFTSVCKPNRLDNMHRATQATCAARRNPKRTREVYRSEIYFEFEMASLVVDSISAQSLEQFTSNVGPAWLVRSRCLGGDKVGRWGRRRAWNQVIFVVSKWQLGDWVSDVYPIWIEELKGNIESSNYFAELFGNRGENEEGKKERKKDWDCEGRRRARIEKSRFSGFRVARAPAFVTPIII